MLSTMSWQTSKPATSVTPVMAPPPSAKPTTSSRPQSTNSVRSNPKYWLPTSENLRADIEALPEAQGLDQLGSSIEAILTGVQQIYDEATDALRCE